MELDSKEIKIIRKLFNCCDSLFEDMIEEVGGKYDYGLRIKDLKKLARKFGAREIETEEWNHNIEEEQEALEYRRQDET